MTTARVDIRLDQAIKAKAEKASVLLGEKSLSSYIINLMDKDATRVIARYESMTLSNDVFDRFMDACAEAGKPNKALTDASTFTREQNIR